MNDVYYIKKIFILGGLWSCLLVGASHERAVRDPFSLVVVTPSKRQSPAYHIIPAACHCKYMCFAQCANEKLAVVLVGQQKNIFKIGDEIDVCWKICGIDPCYLELEHIQRGEKRKIKIENEA